VCELSISERIITSYSVNYRLSVRIISSRRVRIIDFPRELLLLAGCELLTFCANYHFLQGVNYRLSERLQVRTCKPNII
jgi:hypothetical protein